MRRLCAHARQRDISQKRTLEQHYPAPDCSNLVCAPCNHRTMQHHTGVKPRVVGDVHGEQRRRTAAQGADGACGGARARCRRARAAATRSARTGPLHAHGVRL